MLAVLGNIRICAGWLAVECRYAGRLTSRPKWHSKAAIRHLAGAGAGCCACTCLPGGRGSGFCATLSPAGPLQLSMSTPTWPGPRPRGDVHGRPSPAIWPTMAPCAILRFSEPLCVSSWCPSPIHHQLQEYTNNLAPWPMSLCCLYVFEHNNGCSSPASATKNHSTRTLQSATPHDP